MTTSNELDWQAIKMFGAVVSARSVRAAAKALGVHHSTVSRRVEQLEVAVGARLFDRRPEGLVPTASAEALFAATARFAEDLVDVERGIAGDDDTLVGRLVVTLPEPLAVMAFAPRLGEFTRAHPELQLHMITGMDLMDIARHEADVAIRLHDDPPETLVGKRLFPYFQSVYASADYLRRRDLGKHPESGRWLGWDASGERFPAWTRETPFGDVPVWGCFPDLRVQLAAARHGLGLAMLPCALGDRDDALVRASGHAPIRGRDIWILTHADLRQTARVRAFTRFAERVLRDLEAELTGAAAG